MEAGLAVQIRFEGWLCKVGSNIPMASHSTRTPGTWQEWPVDPSWEDRNQSSTLPRDLGALESRERSLKIAMPAHLQGKLKCHLGGSQGHTRHPRRLGEAERPHPGVSQEAGQAGVWSILSSELHRGWAVCPLRGKRTHR